MPLPRVIARLNNRYTNRFIEPLVARLAGYVQVVHLGRNSGHTYRTSLYSFPADGQLLIAATYGPETDWVQNVLAGGAIVERRDGAHPVESAALVSHQVARKYLPRAVRLGLRLLRVEDFIVLSVFPNAVDPEKG